MDSLTGWTIREFGPLAVPRAGQTVRMDAGQLRLYRQLIEWETERRLTVADGRVLLGDSVVEEYTFGKDYCFVATGRRTRRIRATGGCCRWSSSWGRPHESCGRTTR